MREEGNTPVGHVAVTMSINGNSEQSTDEQRQLASRASLLRVLLVYSATSVCNVETVLLYFISADGFLKHIFESDSLPPTIEKLRAHLAHNITELDYPWQMQLLLVFSTFSLALLLTNQLTMPDRLRRLFSWETQSKSKCQKILGLFFAILGGFWKTFVSSCSFLAAQGSPFRINFQAAIAIAAITVPGNLAANLFNFSEEELKNLKCCKFRPCIAKPLAAYLALGYTFSNMALYFNTVDRAGERIGTIKRPLANSLSSPSSVIAFVLNVLGVLNFGVQTYLSYYKRSLAVFQETPDTQAIPLLAETYPETSYKMWDRSGVFPVIAALFKSTACFLSLLVAIDLMWDLSEATPAKKSVSALLVLPQALNFLVQLTYYANLKLKDSGKVPGKNGMYANYHTLCGFFSRARERASHCCLDCRNISATL